MNECQIENGVKCITHDSYDVRLRCSSLELDLAVATAAKEHAEKQWWGQADAAWQIGQKHDALDRDLAAARARIAVLEEEDREWDKHSLTQLVEERRELQKRVAALTEAMKSALDHINAALTPAKETT